MPVRLLVPYNGQAANTTYWGSDEAELKGSGNADDRTELASDYQEQGRYVTAASATIFRNALVYNMNSASAQTLTMPLTGFWKIGTVVTVIQWGAGKTTITPAAGVTIAAGNGNASLVTGGQNYVAQLIKTAANTWIAVGGLSG